MNQAALQVQSFTGNLELFASFVRKSRRTIRRWLAENPPRVAYWRMGNSVLFGEEAVIDAVMSGRVESSPVMRLKSREVVRSEWRAHCAVQKLDVKALGVEAQIAELRRRVEQLEQTVVNGHVWAKQN